VTITDGALGELARLAATARFASRRSSRNSYKLIPLDATLAAFTDIEVQIGVQAECYQLALGQAHRLPISRDLIAAK